MFFSYFESYLGLIYWNLLLLGQKYTISKLCFSVVLNHIWEKFAENFTFFYQKVIISERRSELPWKLVFLHNFFIVKSWEIFLYDGNNAFCSNQRNRTNINKNGFATQNEPRKAKLCFSVVLIDIWEKILWKLHCLVKKLIFQKEAQNYSEN